VFYPNQVQTASDANKKYLIVKSILILNVKGAKIFSQEKGRETH